MPFYTFINKETKEVTEENMPFNDVPKYLEDNSHLTEKLAAPSYGDSVRLGITKPPDSFNEILKHAKKSHLHSTIKTR